MKYDGYPKSSQRCRIEPLAVPQHHKDGMQHSGGVQERRCAEPENPRFDHLSLILRSRGLSRTARWNRCDHLWKMLTRFAHLPCSGTKRLSSHDYPKLESLLGPGVPGNGRNARNRTSDREDVVARRSSGSDLRAATAIRRRGCSATSSRNGR